ncbi:hypothetical protein KQ310_06295 [Synechococcus sp. CS-1328]|nr:hypothetical protein [Synechococcus sp. CS-1328]MCT0224763.1 hypothetical protein [Synechococcus sp. CS-1328]
MLGVADTVEAMATHRPYRFSKGIEAALATIEAGKGSLYDPAVVDACLRLFWQQGYQLPNPEKRRELSAPAATPLANTESKGERHG